MKVRKCLLIGLLFILITGCSRGADSPQIDLRSYFPYVPGMVYDFKGEGNEFSSFTRTIKYKKDSFMQLHDNNGGTVVAKVYRLAEDKIALAASRPEFYEDTNLLLTLDEEKEEEIILKTPLEVGKSWESGGYKREIISIEESLELPAGKFYDVIKVKITPLEEDKDFINYEYYAQNVGLVMRESGDEQEIKSKLKSYSRENNDNSIKTGNKRADIKDPDLPLLAFQLVHQTNSLFRSAYESYINLDRLTTYNRENFQQITAVLESGLDNIIVEDRIGAYKKRLENYYQADTGELVFPSHEVVKEAQLVEKTDNRAEVKLKIKKYYPEREWSGEAYDRLVELNVKLIKEEGKWKIEEIIK